MGTYMYLKEHLFLYLTLSCTLVSSEERYANFVYADRRVYTGQYIDARVCLVTATINSHKKDDIVYYVLQRNGKGTMTWPNKSCYVVSNYASSMYTCTYIIT